MNTLAVMCIAFTRHKPSRTPLARTISAIFGVMFSNAIRAGRLNVRYSVYDFIAINFAFRGRSNRFSAVIVLTPRQTLARMCGVADTHPEKSRREFTNETCNRPRLGIAPAARRGRRQNPEGSRQERFDESRPNVSLLGRQLLA